MVDVAESLETRLRGWARSLSREADTSLGPVSQELHLGHSNLDLLGTAALLRANEVWVAALDLWRDEDNAFEFLTRKHAMLADQQPIVAALQSQNGVRSVKSILGRLRYGSAA